jgi:pyrroline-5-carboxylate reductase
MPNTPAMVGCGVSAVCFDEASEEQQAWTLRLLQASGLVFTVAESAMDAVTGLSGSGPAYVMLVIEAMADGGVRMGLPRDMALQMAAMTVMGSAKLVLETGKHPAVLKDQVCSPGGTTIEAVERLEAGGLRATLIDAVSAATRRSRELGKPQQG